MALLAIFPGIHAALSAERTARALLGAAAAAGSPAGCAAESGPLAVAEETLGHFDGAAAVRGPLSAAAGIPGSLSAAAGIPGSLSAAGASSAGLVPLPPIIKSDCGFGLLVEGEEGGEAAWLDALRDAGLAVSEAYRRTGGSGNQGRSYERIG